METEIGKEVLEAAEIELIYRTKIKASQRPVISSTKDAYKLALRIWDPDQIELFESFKVILLNRASKVLGVYQASTGGTTRTVADVRLIMIAALKANASALILLHNHPSGNNNPSQEDELITQQIKNACNFLSIRLLDHLIVTTETYFSLAEEGLL